MLRRSPSSPWILALCLAACEEGEISLLEPPVGDPASDAPACNPDPQAIDHCPDTGMGGTSGPGGTSGAAGAPADAGACSSRAECTSGGRPICNPANGLCVECTSDTDCESDRSCDSVSGECVRTCVTDTDCTSGDQPVCDVPRHVCVQCWTDANCRADEPRCLLSECVECVATSDCQDPSKPVCAGDHQCR